MDAGGHIETATRRLNQTIVDRSKTVVLVFLVLTVVAMGGMGMISTQTDSTEASKADPEIPNRSGSGLELTHLSSTKGFQKASKFESVPPHSK